MKGLGQIPKSAELVPKSHTILRTKAQKEWMEILFEADVPISPIQDLEQVTSDPHVLARDMVQEITCVGQRLRQVGFPIKLSVTPATLKLSPRSLGEHTEQILTHLSYDLQSIRTWRKVACATFT
jgi:crotonobetainyl-CoA:carnitine CoA-transferase CaiB-like acyl-CoA transferase